MQSPLCTKNRNLIVRIAIDFGNFEIRQKVELTTFNSFYLTTQCSYTFTIQCTTDIKQFYSKWHQPCLPSVLSIVQSISLSTVSVISLRIVAIPRCLTTKSENVFGNS